LKTDVYFLFAKKQSSKETELKLKIGNGLSTKVVTDIVKPIFEIDYQPPMNHQFF
jgi:hypothetical protein